MILCEPLKLDSATDPFKDTRNPSKSCYSYLKTIALESRKYCSQVCHKILIFEGRTVKLQIQQVLKKTVKNPSNLNTYYHKKKHTKKHWMKKRNKRTTCEATAGASAAAITIGCLPKHMEKFLVTFTCEGKPGLLWNIDIQATGFLYYICHFAQYSFTNHNSPFVPHALHISCKQTNKQAHKINVGM